jgi:hypothetical protein
MGCLQNCHPHESPPPRPPLPTLKLTLICMSSATSEINLMATVSNNALHNRHSDLSSDQAAALRDIARNGSVDEGSLYGFNDVGHHGQPNGAAPQL